jgi:hypothetical protein
MLADLHRLRPGRMRSVSAENPTGEKGGGARADAAPGHGLGRGWKARAYVPVAPCETAVLADLEGPGVVRHIWITLDVNHLRTAVLRMHWDGETTPSVEVPIGELFACGHGRPADVNSAAVCVNPAGALNCYWPMPFRRSARISVENCGDREIPALFYQVTYELSTSRTTRRISTRSAAPRAATAPIRSTSSSTASAAAGTTRAPTWPGRSTTRAGGVRAR